jgi:hypothetical protein
MFFHEATILELSSEATEVTLVAGDVKLDDRGTLGTATLRMKGVTAILVDGVLAPAVAMEYDDGEILTLSPLEDHADLIVEWNDFAAKRRVTKGYRFDYDSLELTTTLADPSS